MAKLAERLWRRLFSRKGPWRMGGVVEAATDIPLALEKNNGVLVGSTEHPKWIAFDCPCGTGHRIMLNLDPARRPVWRITSTNPLTLRPSIDSVEKKRRCHFVMSNGQVLWVRERRRSRREIPDGR
jgi:hypothetical protein